MKRLLSIALTTLMLTASAFIGDRQPTSAQTNPIASSPRSLDSQRTRFDCVQTGGVFNHPATVVATPRGSFPIILWTSRSFDRWKSADKVSYDPMARCQMVSRKLQIYYDCDLLDPKYIAAATIPFKRRGVTEVFPAVLITNLNHPQAEACSSLLANGTDPIVKGLLFMLPPQSDISSAAERVRQILNHLNEVRSPGDEAIPPIVN